MKEKKIGIVGLGRMGANMARCLKEKGYQVTALFDINVETTEALAEELGNTLCQKLSEVTAAADIVLTVVTDDAAMDSIFFGEDNLLIKIPVSR